MKIIIVLHSKTVRSIIYVGNFQKKLNSTITPSKGSPLRDIRMLRSYTRAIVPKRRPFAAYPKRSVFLGRKHGETIFVPPTNRRRSHTTVVSMSFRWKRCSYSAPPRMEDERMMAVFAGTTAITIRWTKRDAQTRRDYVRAYLHVTNARRSRAHRLWPYWILDYSQCCYGASGRLFNNETRRFIFSYKLVIDPSRPTHCPVRDNRAVG